MTISRKYSDGLMPCSLAERLKISLISYGTSVLTSSVHFPNGFDTPDRENFDSSSLMVSFSIKKPALIRRQGRLLGGSVLCFTGDAPVELDNGIAEIVVRAFALSSVQPRDVALPCSADRSDALLRIFGINQLLNYFCPVHARIIAIAIINVNHHRNQI